MLKLFEEQTIEYYAERARGGFGLIITEYAGVDHSGIVSLNQLRIFSDDSIPGFKRLTDAVHAGGANFFYRYTMAGCMQILISPGKSLFRLPRCRPEWVKYQGSLKPRKYTT